MLNRRHLLAGSTATLFAPRALAQTVKKPVHVIVGFPAGGGTDVTARVLAEALRGAYASTVLVENKPGASARIAVDYVKNAEPDGSVMLFTPDFPKFKLLIRPQLSPPRERRSCASPFSKSQSGVQLPLASVHDRVTLVGTRLLGCNAE